MIRLLSQLHLCLCLLSASSYMLITISPAQSETDIYAKLRMYQHEGISEAEVPTQRSGHNKGSKITIFFSWLIKILEQWREFTCKYVFTKTVNWRPRRHWSQYKIKTIFKKINQSFGLFWKQNSKRNDLLCLLDLTSRIGGFLFYVFFLIFAVLVNQNKDLNKTSSPSLGNCEMQVFTFWGTFKNK